MNPAKRKKLYRMKTKAESGKTQTVEVQAQPVVEQTPSISVNVELIVSPVAEEVVVEPVSENPEVKEEPVVQTEPVSVQVTEDTRPSRRKFRQESQ